jgi:hypothetical protein
VHRMRALAAIRGTRLLGVAMHRRLSKRLTLQQLAVRVSGPAGTVANTAVGRLRAFARFA